MKKNLLLLFCLFATTNAFAYRIIYANEARDSVKIDFGLADMYERSYNVYYVDLIIDGKRYAFLDRSKDGWIEIIFPKKLLRADTKEVRLEIFHKTDKSQNTTLKISNPEVCDGFCHTGIIFLKKGFTGPYDGGNTRTILYNEIEKGAY